MKRFLVSLLAFVVAIVLILVGLVCIGRSGEWTRRKDDLLTQLAFKERLYAQCIHNAAIHPDNDAVDVVAAEVAHTKIALVTCYESKPGFFSSDERKRIKQWNDEIAALNGRGQTTTHEPFSVSEFPTSLPARPSLAAPPFPYELRDKHIKGSGYARAWFDELGHCTNVVMIVSTGSGLLDINTISFGQANWVGRPNTSLDVPITYKLN